MLLGVDLSFFITHYAYYFLKIAKLSWWICYIGTMVFADKWLYYISTGKAKWWSNFLSEIDVDLIFHTYLQSSLIALLSFIYFDCLIQPFICVNSYIGLWYCLVQICIPVNLVDVKTS